MRKRVQVLLEESELRDIQRIASRRRITVSEWVRQVLQAAQRNEQRRNTRRKLQAVRAAAKHAFPTADIGEMLDQVERG